MDLNISKYGTIYNADKTVTLMYKLSKISKTKNIKTSKVNWTGQVCCSLNLNLFAVWIWNCQLENTVFQELSMPFTRRQRMSPG